MDRLPPEILEYIYEMLNLNSRLRLSLCAKWLRCIIRVDDLLKRLRLLEELNNIKYYYFYHDYVDFQSYESKLVIGKSCWGYALATDVHESRNTLYAERSQKGIFKLKSGKIYIGKQGKVRVLTPPTERSHFLRI